MTKKRRRFTADFKKRVALEALRERDTVQAITARYEVHPNQVSAWKRQAVEGLAEVFSQPGSKRGVRRRTRCCVWTRCTGRATKGGRWRTSTTSTGSGTRGSGRTRG